MSAWPMTNVQGSVLTWSASTGVPVRAATAGMPHNIPVSVSFLLHLMSGKRSQEVLNTTRVVVKVTLYDVISVTSGGRFTSRLSLCPEQQPAFWQNIALAPGFRMTTN